MCRRAGDDGHSGRSRRRFRLATGGARVPAAAAIAAATLAWAFAWTPPALAQGANIFAPKALVNGLVVTQFEIDQRALLLETLGIGGAGDARNSLVEDRLKQFAMRGEGAEASPADVDLAIEDVALRLELTTEEFLAALEAEGIRERTVRDFLGVSVAWNQFAQELFQARARPADGEIDRALRQTGRGSVEVRLAEVVIPVDEGNRDKVDVVARRIAQMTDEEEFSEAALRYSEAPTSQDGGLTNWIGLVDLPGELRPLILGLGPGEVTEPIQLADAVGLFQLRGIREVAGVRREYAEIQYAVVPLDPESVGENPSGAIASARRCDDLYGPDSDHDPGEVSRFALAPADIPPAEAEALSGLDDGESALVAGTGPDGRLRAVMLCGRTAIENEDATREEVAQALTRRRLSSLADQYVAQLRADAVIEIR